MSVNVITEVSAIWEKFRSWHEKVKVRNVCDVTTTRTLEIYL